MSFKIKGRIVAALPEVSGTAKSGNAWRKCEYVIETGDKFPKKIAFSVMNDNIEKCNLSYNEEVEVDVDIESREYNGKWYTSVNAWSATHLSTPTPQQQYAPQQASASVYPPQSAQSAPPADDLPF